MGDYDRSMEAGWRNPHAKDRLPLRSWLFAPGNRAPVMVKALGSDADAIILDLEDAVPRPEKATARQTVAEIVRASDRNHLFVRINALSTDQALGDLLSIVPAAPSGIILPKAGSAAEIATADLFIARMEAEADMPPGLLEIVPLIEDARGMANLQAITTASGRVRRLSFGAADFTQDLGMAWSRDEHELLSFRTQLVLASRAAGLEAPIDAVWVELGDKAGMTLSAKRSRDHGFQGKLCIHPKQVEAVHAAYRPEADALAQAGKIVSAAASAGHAAIVVDGKMVDHAIVAAAQRLLAEEERYRAADRSG